MKKLFIAASLLIGLLGLGKLDAQSFLLPTGPSGDLATSDYAGVDYSSAAITYSTQAVLAFYGPGSITGFIASSNTSATDYVSFLDTESVVTSDITGVALNGSEKFRVFLSSIPVGTAPAGVGPILGTYFKFPASVRVKRGAAFRCSTSNINIIRLLYTKFGEDYAQ